MLIYCYFPSKRVAPVKCILILKEFTGVFLADLSQHTQTQNVCISVDHCWRNIYQCPDFGVENS